MNYRPFALVVLIISMGASTASTVMLKRGPSVHFIDTSQNPHTVSPRSMTIAWWTDNGTDSFVEYGRTKIYEKGIIKGIVKSSFSFAIQEGTGVQHWATLQNLEPHTKYYYRIKSNNQIFVPLPGEEDSYYFVTAKDGTFNKFSFIALGDTADGDEDPAKICETIEQSHADAEFILILGDVVYENSTDIEYGERYYPLNYYGRLIRNKPVIATLGNHEQRDRTPDQDVYKAHHFLPTNGVKLDEKTHSFEYANALFVSLDSNERSGPLYNPGGTHFEWSKKILGNSKKNWKFVCFHHPMLGVGIEKSRWCEDGNCASGPCAGQKRCENNVEWRNDLLPLFIKNNVSLLFSGHDHNYQRTYKVNVLNDSLSTPYRDEQNGLVHVVSGAGGAHLRNEWMNPLPDWSAHHNGTTHSFSKIYVTNDKIEFYQYDKNNKLIDSFTFEKSPPVSTKPEKPKKQIH